MICVNIKKARKMPNKPKLPEDVEKRFAKEVMDRNFGRIEYVNVGEIRYFLAQELATLKAQVRKEIEEQITKMENSNWLHGMGLSGSQAEYIEANIKASYRSIPSLKEEE